MTKRMRTEMGWPGWIDEETGMPVPKSTRARLTDQLAEARITALELGEVGAAGVITGLMAAVREREGAR
jgi:hypothetical protein